MVGQAVVPLVGGKGHCTGRQTTSHRHWRYGTTSVCRTGWRSPNPDRSGFAGPNILAGDRTLGTASSCCASSYPGGLKWTYKKRGFSEEKDLFERNMGREARAPEGAREEWLGVLQTLAEQIQKEQQTSQKMVQEMMDTYMQLLSTPGTYLAGQTDQQHQTVQQSAQQLMEQVHQQQQTFQQQAQQQQEAFQEMTRQVLNTYTQLFNIPLSNAQEGLRSARFPIEGYDELTVEEVSGRLGGLSVDEIRMVRDYEERTKRRDTLLEQLDSKIRGGL
jgi:gas vesicle protein